MPVAADTREAPKMTPKTIRMRLWSLALRHSREFFPASIGALLAVLYLGGGAAGIAALIAMFCAYVFGVGIGSEAAQRTAADILSELTKEVERR